MKHYAAYCFDLYGTLVDIHTDEGRPGFWKALRGVFADLGASDIPAAGALRARYLDRVREQERRLQAANPGAAVEIELREVFSALLNEYGACADNEAVSTLALRFRKLSTTHLRSYAGAREMLEALRTRGDKVILLSNAQRCFTEPELCALGLWDCFDRIFISSDLGFKKPDLRFYARALHSAELEPADCLMIGNDPACDILGAISAGMDAFYIRSGLTPADALPASALPAVGTLPGMDLRRLCSLLMNQHKLSSLREN